MTSLETTENRLNKELSESLSKERSAVMESAQSKEKIVEMEQRIKQFAEENKDYKKKLNEINVKMDLVS